jgi:hypothetical protein
MHSNFSIPGTSLYGELMVPFLSLDSPRKQTLLVIQFFFLKLFSQLSNLSKELVILIYQKSLTTTLHPPLSIFCSTWRGSIPKPHNLPYNFPLLPKKTLSSQFLTASPYTVSSSLSHTINFHV